MAEEADNKTEKAGKKSGKSLIFIILIVVILAGAGVGGNFFLFGNKATEEHGVNTSAVPDVIPVAQIPQNYNVGNIAEPGPIVSYPSFIVNLADAGGNRYLKITIALELTKDNPKEKNSFQSEVEAKEPKIKDIILSILSSKTYEEISTPQGKIALKQEILRRLNTIMSGGKIVDIYITEFVVQ